MDEYYSFNTNGWGGYRDYIDGWLNGNGYGSENYNHGDGRTTSFGNVFGDAYGNSEYMIYYR